LIAKLFEVAAECEAIVDRDERTATRAKRAKPLLEWLDHWMISIASRSIRRDLWRPPSVTTTISGTPYTVSSKTHASVCSTTCPSSNFETCKLALDLLQAHQGVFVHSPFFTWLPKRVHPCPTGSDFRRHIGAAKGTPRDCAVAPATITACAGSARHDAVDGTGTLVQRGHLGAAPRVNGSVQLPRACG
jgi:hypothetical protein